MVLRVLAANLRFLFHNHSAQQTAAPEAPETRVVRATDHFTFVSGPSAAPPLFSADESPSRPLSVFDFADLLFVPVVNLDGYSYVSLNYGRKTWEEARSKRKNFNGESACE